MSNGTSKSGSKSSFHFLAGLGSGVLSAALLQPIDLLKTRVQQSPHQNILRTISEIRHTSPAGLRGLWRGTVPSALRTGFGSALYFSTLNAIRQAAVPLFAHHGSVTASAPSNSGSTNINDSSRLVKLSNTGNLLAGAVARGFAGFILMPLTIIKVRYESSLYSYCSISGAAVDILRTEGPRGFFAGFGATALRDAPYAGLYVLLYEQFKRHLGGAISSSSSSSSAAKGTITSNNRMGVSSAAAVNFSSGVLAATACSIVSNPFDAVKTRIQLRPGRYRNMVYAARTMLAEEGVRSFFSGLGLRMSRKALSSALAWTLYEELIMRAEVGWSLSSSRTERAM